MVYKACTGVGWVWGKCKAWICLVCVGIKKDNEVRTFS
jgi:hypothetical protein